MDVSILNMVLCNAVMVGAETHLNSVGVRWSAPPSQLAVWLEFANPSERAFSFAVRLMRRGAIIVESESELVLAGHDYWHGHAVFERLDSLPPKTYAVVVLLDGVPARTMLADFGHPEGK